MTEIASLRTYGRDRDLRMLVMSTGKMTLVEELFAMADEVRQRLEAKERERKKK